MSGNVQVTVDSNPNNGRSESALEANPLNPLNMVGASKRFTNPAAYQFSVAAYATFDGGHTWSEAPPLALLPGWGGLSDPAVAWDNHGNAFLVGLPFRATIADRGGLAVYKSSDGGRSWSAPNLIHTSPGDDKQWAAGDSWPASPHYGNVYVVWDDGNNLAFARTTDNGTTWRGVGGQPVGTPLAFDSHAPEVAVGADGVVYVVWINGSSIEFVKSTDGGDSFTAPQVAVSSIIPLSSPPLLQGLTGDPELPGGRFRVLTLPTCCAGLDGSVVVAWADYREGVSRIYHRYSQDGGKTWLGLFSGEPLLAGGLTSGPHQHDFHPQLNVRPNGVMACAFYSFGPKDAGPLAIDVVLASSFTGGVDFTTRETVTDHPWDPGVDAPLANGDPTTTFIGEYFGLAASSSGFFPFWTDTRSGIQEIFSAVPMQVDGNGFVLFNRTLQPKETYRQSTIWPAYHYIQFAVRAKSATAQFSWSISAGRTSANFVTYWIVVSNLTDVPVEIDAVVGFLATG